VGSHCCSESGAGGRCKAGAAPVGLTGWVFLLGPGGADVADFAIVNQREELLLIEIEKAGTRLLAKDRQLTAELQHAVTQEPPQFCAAGTFFSLFRKA
jgi:hypothetical protein